MCFFKETLRAQAMRNYIPGFCNETKTNRLQAESKVFLRTRHRDEAPASWIISFPAYPKTTDEHELQTLHLFHCFAHALALPLWRPRDRRK